VDSFSILLQHGSGVRIANLDVVTEVLRNARCLAPHKTFHADSFHWICGDGEYLPFRDECFDWTIMNGVLNLFPEKLALLGEVHRTLRLGGRLLVADLCCTNALPDYFSEEPDAWAWCMSGACSPEQLAALLDQAGFGRIRIREDDGDDQFCRVIVTSINGR
jgi:SAM-dependent methyltransferase